jgi:hypothetical protein
MSWSGDWDRRIKIESVPRSEGKMVRRYLAYFIVILIAGILQGCTSHSSAVDTERPPSTMPSQADLVGTWRLVSMTEGGTGKVHQMGDDVFFVRFYSDGKCASWPVPKEEIERPGDWNTDDKRVSRGLYKVEDGQLTLPDAQFGDKVQLRVTSQKLWYWNNAGETCLYYRVQPDLEPGRLP